MNKEKFMKKANEIFHNDMYGNCVIKTNDNFVHISRTGMIRVFKDFIEINKENVFFENIKEIKSYEN